MGIKAILLLCGMALSSGCTGARGMRAEAAPIYVPAAGLATLVFTHHGDLGTDVKFVAVDQSRRFVAGMTGQAHSVSMLQPGDYFLYILSGESEVIHAQLAPGRTYVIEARARMGFWNVQLSTEAVRRNTPAFSKAPGWLHGTRALVPDGSKGQKWVARHDDDISRRIAQMDESWRRRAPAWKELHTLTPEDGYLPEELEGAQANITRR